MLGNRGAGSRKQGTGGTTGSNKIARGPSNGSRRGTMAAPRYSIVPVAVAPLRLRAGATSPRWHPKDARGAAADPLRVGGGAYDDMRGGDGAFCGREPVDRSKKAFPADLPAGNRLRFQGKSVRGWQRRGTESHFATKKYGPSPSQ